MATDESIYGIDLVVENNDLKINTTGDFNYIDGLENLAQSLKHRLYTERGDGCCSDISGF